MGVVTHFGANVGAIWRFGAGIYAVLAVAVLFVYGIMAIRAFLA